MSLLWRRRDEQRLVSRSSIYGTLDPVTAFLTGQDAEPTTQSILRLAPVYAATRLIADQVASLPWHAHVDRDGIPERLRPQPDLIANPSRYGTRYDWLFRLMTSVLLRGNAVGLRGNEVRGWPTKVEWLDPTKVACREDEPGKPLYYDGRLLDENQIVHIPGYVLPDARWGLTPIGAFRSIADVGLGAQDYAAAWFTAGAPVPRGILRNTEMSVVADVAKAAKESYRKNLAHGDLFVTGKDWEWTSVQLPADDVRFIEAMRASATQVAAIYGVPSEMIGGESGGSLTYNTVELNLLSLAMITLRPWVTRIEQALTGLLPRGQYVKANLDAAVRSDTKTKYEVYKIQADMRHRTPNELRALDDLPPLPGGDEFPKPPPVAVPQPNKEPEDDEDGEGPDRRQDGG